MATVLIVDDDNNIRETLHDLLADAHECHTADRAEQALAYLEFETYDAILTDLAMPGLTGREILKHIQERHISTPVIVISGDTDEAVVTELLEMGAFAFITKPFLLEDVEETVMRAIARNQELAEAGPEANESDSSEPTSTVS